jgi:hypothetical protein
MVGRIFLSKASWKSKEIKHMGVLFTSAIAVVSLTMRHRRWCYPACHKIGSFLDFRPLVVAGSLPVSLLGFYSLHLVM